MRADFDRVYSPPEDPGRPSRRRFRGAAVALISLGVVAGGAAVVVPKFADQDRTATAGRPSPRPVETPPAAQSPSVTQATTPAATTPAAGTGVVETLPKICQTVSKNTFLRLVPGGQVEEHGGGRAGSCGYSSLSGDPRYLRLETRLGNIQGDLDPVSEAKWSYDQDLAREQKDKISRTLSVATIPGLGEQAFHRFMADEDQRTVTARVEARITNVIVTVSYSKPYSGDPEDQQKDCLDEATAVVREALKSYT